MYKNLRLRLAVLTATALAVLTVLPLVAGAKPATPTSAIGASLPRIADFPGARLSPRATRDFATDTRRAPYPCTAYRARGMRGTPNWGEWAVSGLGRRVRVLTFSYGDARIASTWAALRTAIRACPATTEVTEDDGTSGTATQTIIQSTATTIRMDIVTRDANGRNAWGSDRAIVYQRVGDAIQKVQVSRNVLTPDDRRFVRRIARVARTRYSEVRRDPEAALPTAEQAPTDPVADAEAPIREAIARLAPGAAVNVSIGDSFISGEAGRWRGNVYYGSNFAKADALGERAYWDTETGESIFGCHRAKGAEIHVPGTVGLNLACSGAITTSKMNTPTFGNRVYKPGIDGGMRDPETGVALPGQLTLLGDVARQARVGTVVLSIGGNDMGFSAVMKSCMVAFAVPFPFSYACKDTPAVQDRLSDASLATVGSKLEAAIVRTHAAMQAAGYANGSWQMIVQNYPRPVAEDNRYPETYADRLYGGGCPFYDADIRWINERLRVLTREFVEAARRAAVTTGQPVRFMDLTHLYAGRELCAKGAAHVDAIPADQVVDKAERVQMVRVLSPWVDAESVHPNEIGQRALQACLREALNDGTARSGRCDAPLDWSKEDATGLPLVRFTPAP